MTPRPSLPPPSFSGKQLSVREILSEWRKFTGKAQVSIGNKLDLQVKVLRLPEEQEKGFRGEPEPEDGFGLYFLYGAPRTLGFWMKDVPYNLELLAFDEEMKLFQVIILQAEDSSTKVISQPCAHVLEVRAGSCERYNITLGDELITDQW